jgi:RNA recognition motif-containing protein
MMNKEARRGEMAGDGRNQKKKKLFLGNLPWAIRTEGLSELLQDLGVAHRSVKVIEESNTGRSRGFAFIEFATEEQVKHAIAILNGYSIEGRVLFINEAEDRKPKPVSKTNVHGW